jgi:hypothetical protein
MDWNLSTLWSSLVTWLGSLVADLHQAAADGIGAALAAVPVPQFIPQMGDFFAALPPDVVFYLQPFQFGIGLQMMLAAWVSGQVIRIIVGIIA